MKSALKLLVTFGVGCLIGIVLVCAGIVSFTDMTWNEPVSYTHLTLPTTPYV